MEPQDERYRHRLRSHLGLVVVGVLVLAVVAVGCHIQEHGHLESIHGEPLGSLERYCVEDLSDNPPDVAQADAWIEEALWNNGHAQDWEVIGNINQGSFGDCANMDLSQRAEVDIYYRLVDETSIECGEHSCAYPGPRNSEHHGHNNYDTYDIFLAASDITGTPALRRSAINHETGHAYGLADPTPVVVQNSYEDCWMAYDTNGDTVPENVRVFSIMHNSGWCGDNFPDYPWPTDCDLRIVDLIAQEHPFAISEDPADYKGSLCGD